MEPFWSPQTNNSYVPRADFERRLWSEVFESTVPVVLFGMGGSGKSTIARNLAQRALANGTISRALWFDEYEGTGWELHLDGPASSFAATSKDIPRLMRQPGVLIVLDGFERTEGPGRDSWRRLIAEGRKILAPGSHLLVLSREPEGSGNDLQLRDLDQEEAKLFLDILTDQIGAPRVTDERDISELLKVVGGSPLALKLAASKLRTISVRQLVDGLTGDGPVLGSRSSPLEQTIQWSISFLSGQQLGVLKALCYLEDGTESRHVAALSNIFDESVTAALEDLDQLSLVSKVAGGGWRVHAGIRSYVLGLEGESGQGTLYITFDPSNVPKRLIIELLDGLNWLYRELGGDELLIREDEIGRFSKVGVAV